MAADSQSQAPQQDIFLISPPFRMDTAKDIASLLRPGDWMASIDLKDAYFHIPVNRRFRRLLRFGWRGRLYQYLVIPFGLCVSMALHSGHVATEGVALDVGHSLHILPRRHFDHRRVEGGVSGEPSHRPELL